jgi:hypothetical protein
MKKLLPYLTLLFMLAGFTVWWVFLYFSPATTDLQKEYFSASYGLVALIGGLYGLLVSRRFGGFKSFLGLAVFFFSAGLLAQEFGQLVYSYYSLVLGIEIPYPSLGDLGYAGSVALYMLGIYFLAKACTIQYLLEKPLSKVVFVVVPALLLGFTYWVFLKDYQMDFSDPLKVFLDLGYPLGQSLYISMAVLLLLLSGKYLGGLMKERVLLFLGALLVQYVADFYFLFLVSREIFDTAGISEYIYLLAYFFMTLALIRLESVFDSVGGISSENGYNE